MKNPRNNIYDEFYFERRNVELEDLLESDTKCLGCNKPMRVEGRIDDDIKLCHLCYEIKYSRKDI